MVSNVTNMIVAGEVIGVVAEVVPTVVVRWHSLIT